MKNIESFGGIRRSKFVLIFVLVVTLLTMNLSYTVNVEAANNNKPVLKITDVSHQELESNKEYELTVTIANVGNSYGEDGLLSLVVPDETPIVIKNQLVSENVPYLNPNVDIEVTYTILVESGATEGQYELGMEGTYYDDNNLLYEFQEFFNIDIVEGEEDAILRATVDHSSNVVAGEKNTISVSIDNEGSGGAWALTVLPINTDDIYQVNSDEGYLATLAGGKSIDFDFEVMVDDQASGFTPIEFDVTYLTQNGSVDLTLSSYVNVDTVESGQVIVSNIAKSKSTLYPGGQATFDVTIENVGTNVVEDIKVEVSQDPGLVPSSQSIVIIPEIDSMSSQVVSFSLEATDSASSQNYPVEFTVTYGNETTSQYSGINISNDEDDEEDTVTKPRIVITEFSLSKEKIFFLGDEFEMAFNVLNTSTLKDVRNLKVVIDTTTGQTGDSVFLPLNQSNSYFVQELETGGTGEIVMPLKVFANAEGKSYSLNISFEYEDYDGNLYTDSETISIPVYENTELTVSDVRVGSTLDNGYTLEVDFYNTGKVDITNMMVDIEGDFITNNSNYYVGDFTTGRTDVYDVEISGAMPTYLEGTIVFTYDDTFGEEEIYVKDFTIGEVSPNQGERGVSSNSEGEVMAQGTQKDSGTGGQEVQGRGPASNGEMTEAQMEELKGMTREERTAFMEAGGFEAMNGSDNASGTSLNYILIGGIALAVIVVVGIGFVLIRRKRKVA